jgi:hypothetical protein
MAVGRLFWKHKKLFWMRGKCWNKMQPRRLAAALVILSLLLLLPAVGVVVAGDSIGQLHFLDPRMSQPVASMLLHKKGTKVSSNHNYWKRAAITMGFLYEFWQRL